MALAIEQVANLVKTALSEHFYPLEIEATGDGQEADETSDDDADDAAGPSTLGRPLTEVVQSSARTNERVARDIADVIAWLHCDLENHLVAPGGSFDADPLYARFGRDHYDAGDWGIFERSIKNEARFFNRAAEDILTNMFQAIHGHRTVAGRPVIVEAGPGTELAALYRARVFQSESKVREAMKRPDRDVGPPPPDLTVGGRMNAPGIAVFYGATTADVALSEVRPPVGSKVLVGRFEVLRSLKLLDMEALEQVDDGEGSIFDPDYINRLQRAEFLRGLSRRISKPVMPDDRDRDYLPTQAIADFLATSVDNPLDGILYPSVQVGHPFGPAGAFGRIPGGRNVVLFRKAASVQPFDLPDDAVIKVEDDDWFGWLGISDGLISDAPGLTYVVNEYSDDAPALEPNDAALRFSRLEVRYVRSISFDTQGTEVPRFRRPKTGA